MSFLKGVKTFLGFEIDEQRSGGTPVFPAKTAATQVVAAEEKKAVPRVVSLDKEKTNILLIEPRNLETDSQDILRLLKDGHVVIINNKYLDNQSTRTVMDRVLGVVYAFDGKMQKIGGGIYLCAPRSVNVIDNQQNDVVFNDDFTTPAPETAQTQVSPVQYAATGTYNAAASPALSSAYETLQQQPAPYQTAALRPAGSQNSYY